MISLEQLSSRIDTGKTVLLLGAGASQPSGLPSGVELADTMWQRLAGEPSPNQDLTESLTLLEARIGRAELADAVRALLKDKRPVGMIKELPSFNWRMIFTTNFDQVVERAYSDANVSLNVVRSNYDFHSAAESNDTSLFKLHGCLSQDRGFGDQASMTLTLDDYGEHQKYRQILFKRFDLELLTHDFLVVGYSLGDPHIRRTLQDIAAIQRDQGAQGRIHLLMYEDSPDWRNYYEGQGFQTCVGGIDDLLRTLASSQPVLSSEDDSDDERYFLPRKLRSNVRIPYDERDLPADANAMFSGSPGSYADIHHELTFERQLETPIRASIESNDQIITGIVGAAGVGKTTLARRVASSFIDNIGWLVWEHITELPFDADEWINVDARLREKNLKAVLVIDDCTNILGGLNRLVRSLSQESNPHLKILITATRANWVPRTKSRYFFSHGTILGLSELTDPDIREMLRLVNNKQELRGLVTPEFIASSAEVQFRELKNKCSADMFVCLKNVFARESLDVILLREVKEMTDEQRDAYTLVCLLQAALESVHRQMILRLTGMDSDRVVSLLNELKDVVNEYDVSVQDGIYGWHTRHLLISQIVSQYQFPDDDSIYEWFMRVLDELNPTVNMELMALRQMCSSDFGIRRISALDRRAEILRKMISVAPSERIPRHRLVRTLLDDSNIDGAEAAIARAIREVGIDAPMARYRVVAKLARATQTTGLMDVHRVAMLREASEQAVEGLRRFPENKHLYRTYCNIGMARAEIDGDTGTLEAAVGKLRDAFNELLDPDLSDGLAFFETRLTYYQGKNAPNSTP